METTNSSAPIAAKRPITHRAHGAIRHDDYSWLQDRSDPAVIDYLNAENEYAESILAPTLADRDTIYSEIESRILPVADSAAVRKGPWEYFERSFSDRPYVQHLRRAVGDRPVGDSTNSRDELILDENILAIGHDFFEIGSYEISPDHRLLAYALDTNGGEVYELRIRDLHTSQDLDDEIPNLYYGVAWSRDSKWIFYTRPDEAVRPYQVWRHRIGSHSSDDLLVFEEPDESFFVGVYESRSGDYILIGTGSRNTSDVRFISSDTPEAEPLLVAERRHGIEYEVDHLRGAIDDTSNELSLDRWAILTNDDALDFRVVTAPIGNSEPSSWSDLAPHRNGTRIAEMDVFSEYIVLSERRDGLEHLRVIQNIDGSEHEIEMADPVYTVATGANPEYASETLRYTYASPTRPPQDIDYNFETRKSVLVKEVEIPGFSKDEYSCERSWATASDGTQIPISIVYKNTTALDGTAPCLLYGYGSYEICIEPSFSNARLSLLDRGFVYAIAHIRGGGEMGRTWYEQGRLLEKRNTFTDFITCAEHLCAENYTSPDRLGARGRSAGGLLMGAVSNLAPNAFSAISAEVPFVDCVSTMSDPLLPLTVGEWEEWGNPIESKDDYEYMLSYSPYDNVANHPYPAMFVAAGLNDPRVMYWEPAKWVAKHRALRDDDNLLILRTEMGSGHGGPSGRQDAWRDEAVVLAFFVHALSTPKGV